MSKQYLDAEFVGDVDFRPVRKAWVYKKDKPKNDYFGVVIAKSKARYEIELGRHSSDDKAKKYFLSYLKRKFTPMESISKEDLRILLEEYGVDGLAKLINEYSGTTTGYGLNTGDAWPDGIFTKYGEERIVGPGGMPRGMVQVDVPKADVVYGGDGGRKTITQSKMNPENKKKMVVIDPHELRDDTPPLSPKQRIYGRRAFGKNPEYTIPLETHDMVHTADVLKKPTTPPEGSVSGGIPATPEPGSKKAGSSSGYRQLQKGGKSVMHDVDKLYVHKKLKESTYKNVMSQLLGKKTKK